MPKGKLPSYKKANVQLVAYRHIQMAVSSLLMRFHLTTTQWIMLGLVHETPGGLRVTDIARALQVEMPLITTTARGMIAAGLLQATAHARDKRAKVLTLTNAGEAKFEQAESFLDSRMAGLEKGVEPQDMRRYFTMLQQIGANASALQ